MATIDGGVGNDVLPGTAEDDSINGFDGNDSLAGLGGNDTLIGGNGNDFLDGGNGDDDLRGIAGSNTILGGAGVDNVFGGNGGDSIDGGLDDDFLQGDLDVASGAADTINGGNGNDTLLGLGGNDSLTGGPGGDIFNFDPGGPTGIDRIADLEQGDVITINNANFPAGGVLAGSGVTVGLDQVEVNASGGITRLFVGTDTVPGADLTIEVSGEFIPENFSQFANSIFFNGTQIPAEVFINNTTAIEGDGGAQNLVFTVQISRTPFSDVTVTVQTTGGTATAGVDYTATTTVVTILANQATTTFSVPILGDLIPEEDETVIATLSNPVGAVLGAQSTATGTISNDDQVPFIIITSAQEQENAAANGGLVFTLSRLGSTAQAVSVTASTLDGSAKAGSDYTAVASVVTIPAGQTTATFTVPVSADNAVEIVEEFLVFLSNPTGGATLANANYFALGTIFNDDFGGLPTVNGAQLSGDGADNFLVGGALNDSLNGANGNDVVLGSAGSDVLIGGAGNDTAIGGDIIVVNFGGVDVVLPDDAETGGDAINVGDGTNFAFAGGGNDTMIGGAGNDLLAAELGNDVIFGGDGDNALYGGDGNDAIQGGNGGDIVFGMFGDDSIAGLGGFDLIIEEPAANGGNDFIDANDGGSQVFAGGGNDIVLAGNGDDFVLGESGNDRIFSGPGNDALIAGPGNDTLDGGSGNDVLIAEGGDDSLTGGLGADTFRYPDGIAVNADRITDFTPADDAVELAASLGFADGAAAFAVVTQVGADAVLILPAGAGSITFVGLSVGALTPADFQIV